MNRLVSVVATMRKLRLGPLVVCETLISMDYHNENGQSPSEEESYSISDEELIASYEDISELYSFDIPPAEIPPAEPLINGWAAGCEDESSYPATSSIIDIYY